jgi:tetratricopeptide (TPR) repeat protein
MVIGSLSAIAALLVHSVVDFNLHIPANTLVVAFLFGVLATPTAETAMLADAPIRRAGMWRWMVVAVAVVLLAVSLRLWPGEIFGEKARVALRDDRNADALGFAQRGLAWEKENPYLYGYLGDAQHFLTLNAPNPASAIQLHEDALAAYSAGLKLFPQDTALLLKRVQDFDQLDRYAEAEQDFQRLFRYDPLFGNVYAYYGLHWELQRRMKAAERCFRLAQRLGESEISPGALQNIERMKTDLVSQAIMSALPDVDLDLPAERALPQP